MNPTFKLSGKLNWLYHTIYFFKKHFVVVLGFGLIAAFGRVIQLGGFGEITPGMDIALEVVVESARILIFLYALGLASIKTGVSRIRRLFTHKDNRKRYWSTATQRLKKQWFSVLLNIIGFLLIAGAINYLIDLVAYETCLYLTLKKDGILSGSSSEWTVLLFFKNLSVIPFVVIFDAVFLLWLTDNLRNSTNSSLE